MAIPLGTFTALPSAGHKAALFVHTHVREDAIQLFGFVTKQEKLVFETLIGVSGIGPKVALSILSGLPLPELVGAIAAQNARLLSSIPGVGKKLAERLGVELKEKMASFGFGEMHVKGREDLRRRRRHRRAEEPRLQGSAGRSGRDRRRAEGFGGRPERDPARPR